jgi:DNA-binding CsgD family transcriptional regulator
MDILKLVAEGHTSREIGEILNIATKTVDVHRNNIRLRLNIHSLAELVKYAIQIGLTGAD